LASLAAYDKTPALLTNLIIQWIEFGQLEPLIISDEVEAETGDGKNDKYS